MDLGDATRMILTESAAHPELLRVTRQTHDRLAQGRRVPHQDLSWMLKEAARKNVFPALRSRYGAASFDAMVTALCREIDRQATASASAAGRVAI
ncbi:hypothetical protein D0T12_01715 [Actinomadura spongiicola]|uniref:Uncharacterized protein n=1 Tax=Actinomadura spongiicola TaxID=2303421 RepID=A0A372GPG1_9ACTN|nr:hypothetical protein [Actinomadura spongiicola]RFS86999.1 hypothetical protein D0T12_01715 [Actinomadura spongiicola]